MLSAGQLLIPQQSPWGGGGVNYHNNNLKGRIQNLKNLKIQETCLSLILLLRRCSVTECFERIAFALSLFLASDFK